MRKSLHTGERGLIPRRRQELLASPQYSDRLWSPPSLPSTQFYSFLFLVGKAIGTWSWSLTSTELRV